jgi:membrane-bound lytic murein transglycosylase F
MRQWLLITTLLLTGCGNPTVLDAFAPDNELVVITRNGPTTYYLGANEPAGLEYELFHAFADSQDMTLRIKVASTIEEVFDTLARGEAHIAAAGINAINCARSGLHLD